jgi:hypothetical protein
MSQCTPNNNKCTIKNLKKKHFRAGGVTQLVKHLPSKCEAPSPNPSAAKNK